MSDRSAGGPTIQVDLALPGVVSEDAHITSLILPITLRDTIIRFLQSCLPDEGVGLLATHRIGSSLSAVRFYPGRNIDRSPRRFTMDPTDVVLALADMRREKTRLGAIVHSHPNTTPVPSPTDLSEAKIPGVLSLIIGFSPVVELSAWSLVYDGHGAAVRFAEVAVSCRDNRERDGLGFGEARATII